MRSYRSNRKATHRQLRRHNRQLLLRAVYDGVAASRAALAQKTGLTKPTVSALVSELIEEGLLVEEGRGPSTGGGGKRPRLLKFVPDARNVIGVAINGESVEGTLTNLDGQVTARHTVALRGAQGKAALHRMEEAINGLIAQLDAPLLCIGVGVAGVVDAAEGVVGYAPHLGWRKFPLAARLVQRYDVPVHLANSTELAAMSHFVFGLREDISSLALVLVGTGVGVGLVIDGASYAGGGEIGHLRLAEHSPIPVHRAEAGRLETFLGWHYVKQRAYALREAHPESLLPAAEEPLSYLHIRWAAANGDPAALTLQDELSRSLAQVFAWTIGLLRPEHIALAGPITDLGQPLLESAIARTRTLILADLVEHVAFSLARSPHLVTIGAVAQSLQLELGLV